MASKELDALYRLVVDDGPILLDCKATPLTAGCHGSCCVPTFSPDRCHSCFPTVEDCVEAMSRGYVYHDILYPQGPQGRLHKRGR